ncbi:MAG: hypothetical protein LBB67_03155 [Oscillospiraceae bacterium]|nr:hypothetical protein [Oscillospiraceae bacterium]
MKKAISIILAIAMLCGVLPLSVFAKDGVIFVNGEVFDGTLKEAIRGAGAAGLVEISGTVYTKPIGWMEADGFIINNVTIQGRGDNAVISLEPTHFDDISNKKDVITIQGSDVTIKNLTINARLLVDFPLRMWGTNQLIEDVTCIGGTRGAVNILGLRTGRTITLRRVRANSSMQGGFYLDDDMDCAGLTFEDCSTRGNVRVGVLVRNSYQSVIGLDLSGVTCYENIFAVEDRAQGTIGGDPAAEVNILAAPKNANGDAIDTSKALFFGVEQACRHFRYGAPEEQYAGADTSIKTTRYGFETELFYTLRSSAENDLRDGESLTISNDFIKQSFGKATAFFSWLGYSAGQLIGMLLAVM